MFVYYNRLDLSGCSSVWLERVIWDHEAAGSSPVIPTTQLNTTGCGSVWLERLIWDQEVASSNPATPTNGQNLSEGKLTSYLFEPSTKCKYSSVG